MSADSHIAVRVKIPNPRKNTENPGEVRTDTPQGDSVYLEVDNAASVSRSEKTPLQEHTEFVPGPSQYSEYMQQQQQFIHQQQQQQQLHQPEIMLNTRNLPPQSENSVTPANPLQDRVHPPTIVHPLPITSENSETDPQNPGECDINRSMAPHFSTTENQTESVVQEDDKGSEEGDKESEVEDEEEISPHQHTSHSPPEQTTSQQGAPSSSPPSRASPPEQVSQPGVRSYSPSRASPPFPGIPQAVPHHPDQCENNSDCIYKLDPQSSNSYKLAPQSSYSADNVNLNEMRAEDSAESEWENESVQKSGSQYEDPGKEGSQYEDPGKQGPQFEDPGASVPRLNLHHLPGNQPDSAASSARSDHSLDYLKNIFSPTSPYPFINPYYLYMNPFHPHQFISPRQHEGGRPEGIIRPTAQYMPAQLTLPPFPPIPLHSPHLHSPHLHSPHLHSPHLPTAHMIPTPAPTKLRTKRKSSSSTTARATKRTRIPADTKPPRRIVSCNYIDNNGSTCDEKFNSSQQLVCHIANIHTREVEHFCNNCAKFSLQKLGMWRRWIESEKLRNNLVGAGSGEKIDVIMIDK